MKFVALLAVAVSLTACAGTVGLTYTSPNGASYTGSYHLDGAQDSKTVKPVLPPAQKPSMFQSVLNLL